MPAHLVMQAREEHAVDDVVDATLGTRIGAVECKGAGFPAQADHRAPFLHHRVLFQPPHQFHSIHVVHVEVCQDHVDPLAPQDIERLFAVAGLGALTNIESRVFQHAAHE